MTLHFTKDHEYIRIEDGTGTVGITDHAQAQLGDIVFIELPQIGKQLTKGSEAAVVESVKAASEIYAPVSGEVLEVNAVLEDAPGRINEDPSGAGWFFKMKLSDPAELQGLMDEDAYADFLKAMS
jgi:glycine cleavage system H protein